jgi:ariadne-1
MEEDSDDMLVDDESASYASDADDDGDDYDDFAPQSHVEPPKAYRCVDQAGLRSMQEAAVKRVADTLCSPVGDVAVLLRAFKWDAERVIGSYFENPEGVLEKAGVCDASKQLVINGTAPEPFRCPICLDPATDFCALGCGHRACTPCYREYITHKIDDEGGAAIHARCPSVKCGVKLTEGLVNALVPEAHKARFALYLEQSYVEDNPRFEWCPSPQCSNAIYMAQLPDQQPFCGAQCVACDCGESFCFACRRDDHSPATCDQLRQWLVKCKDDSETYNWLQANTRSCPVCKTAIEKSGGCNHMTCKKCQHEWCWVCSGPWKEHSGTPRGGVRARLPSPRAPRARTARSLGSLSPRASRPARPLRIRAAPARWLPCA